MKRITTVGKAKKFGRTLMEQNCKRKDIGYKMLKGLESFWCTVDKFTIVELLFSGKRYHGLSSKSDQDTESITEGVAHAYKRAFDEMVEDIIIKEVEDTCRLAEVTIGIGFETAIGVMPIGLEGTIEIGTLVRESEVPFIPLTGIYKVKCVNCGELSVCDMRYISLNTRCSKCNRKLMSTEEYYTGGKPD